ncbi:DUF5362 domain-containing protein [Streptomyces cinnabarinus]|uniref:DUF5362 domain-containing protein n=1 Tax=Streptomyces cinnabarinus TaxID=67287 RepID=A0ABY7KT21_9ACTN|nr:DUF5362 family protein [Streptomyces cinnabarinus]WAZ26532.1 DUF5362 domain-containing protein [Streptomyces cinnabarinus]
MSDRARNPRLPQADGTAVWKAPQWGEQAPAQVVFPGHGRPIDPEQREAELTRFVGRMTADGWTEVHRMPGAVLLAQVQPAHGATAVGVGATGVAAGAAVGGVGLLGVLGGIGMIILGVLLTLTIIGAIIGIPMIAAGMAVFTGGAAAATAGGAVGAAGMAVGISGTASHDRTLRIQAWTDETGRILAKGA